MLRSSLGAGDADYVLSQMRNIDLENAYPSPPTAGRTQGGAYRHGINIPTSKRFHLGEHRPTDALSYGDIEMMRKNGQVVFTLMLKKSPVRTVFRNDRSLHIEGGDKTMTDVITHNLISKILPRYMGDILTYLDYGTAFFELVWQNTTMKELGLRRSDSGNNVAVLRKLNAVYPATVEQILVTPNGSFNGFTQRVSGTKGPFVKVPVDQSLIFTHDGYFRNKWGSSYLTPMFPFWYWYEVVWRLFLRYMERMATPVVVGKAPQTHKVVDSTGNLVDAMDKALEIAGDVGYSNAVAIPSDVDENGNPLWVLDYLTSPAGSENVFIRALEELGTMIIRSGLMADRVATQEASVGSYNMSSIHYIVTQLHNEWILDDIVYHLNEYLLWKYEYYNRGIRNSSTRLVTEGLDIEEKTRLFQLLMKLADSKHPDLERIDVEKSLAINNIPVKSEEAFQKAQEDKLTRMVEVQKIMAKSKTFPQDDKDSGNATDKEKAEQSLSAFTHSLATSRGALPALVTEQTLNEMADRGIGIETGSYTKVFPGVSFEDSSGLTDEELEEIKEAIFAELGINDEDLDDKTTAALWAAILRELLGKGEEFSAAEFTEIELDLKSFFKKIIAGAKKIFRKVYKTVTGKEYKSRDERWKETVRRAEKEYGAKSGEVIITKDGRTWRSEDHPRDEAGRWAKKGAAAKETTGDEPVETTDEGAKEEIAEPPSPADEIGEMFHPDKWEIAPQYSDAGVLGIEIEGLKYYSVGEPDPEFFAGLHETRKRIYDRAKKLDYELVPVDVLVVNWGDREAIKKQYPDVGEADIDEYLDRTGGFMAMHDQTRKVVVIDMKLQQESPEIAEAMIYHETLHGQPRENGRAIKSSVFDADEVLTTLLTMEYGEANGLPVANGYPTWISWAAQAALAQGWSKQKLYDYAREAHKIGGQDAYDLVSTLWESSGVEIESARGASRYPEAIESLWPGWEETWRTVADVYGIDYEKLLRGMWGE